MAEIKVDAWKVTITEYERGWGSKVDEVKFFDSEQSARDFVLNYNLKYNNLQIVPDWYMVAEYRGKV